MATLQTAGRIGWQRQHSSAYKWMIVVGICAILAVAAIVTTLAVVDSSPAAPVAPAGDAFSVDSAALQRFHADTAGIAPPVEVAAPTGRELAIDDGERRQQLRHEKTRTP